MTRYVPSAKRARLYKVEDLADRFWRKVDKAGPVPAHCPELGPCWIFQGSKDHRGYGQIRAGGRGSRLLKAHRVAWALVNGEPPATALVLHRCDTPACSRAEPDGGGHLFLGDAKANADDMDAKGRRVTKPVQGERVGGVKLTEAKVLELRQLRAQGWSQPRLAARFGVSQAAVWNVLAGRTWKSVSSSRQLVTEAGRGQVRASPNLMETR